MTDIVLATLNARHQHASLGLRYLQANLGALQSRSVIAEFVVGADSATIVERLLAHAPHIVGFGVYIWNVEQTTAVIALLKRVAPEVSVVIGGPEVSHEIDDQPICTLADHIVTGQADLGFAQLCAVLLAGGSAPARVQHCEPPALAQVRLPYALYSDHDIAHRTLYVEASRGCPFKCEFCLSSLDRTAWPIDVERFLREIEGLLARGARRFKFVDRTFNLRVATSLRILEFFQAHLDAHPQDPVFVHFELIPDHLPERLKGPISRFPAGTLQFEIGIQTLDPAGQALISRQQDNAQALANIAWLLEHSQAHLHLDLIAGLPGESIETLARSFDTLAGLRPHEIQLGILKRLRGTPIIRHTTSHAMRYNPQPPYNVLATDAVSFRDMQRITRFARYWDLIANSARFPETLPRLLGATPFERFMRLSDWLFAQTDATHRFAPDRLLGLLERWLEEDDPAQAVSSRAAVLRDRSMLQASSTSRARLPRGPLEVAAQSGTTAQSAPATPKRQRRALDIPVVVRH